MEDVLIRLRGITKQWGKKVVLDNVNLDIKKGEILGLVGINGSGKTTLLRILVGYYNATRGELFYKSEPFSHVKGIKNKIGIATQDSCFYKKLTVRENVEHFGKLYGLTDNEIEASLDNTLELLNLYNLRNILAEKLSGGMQKRIDIACSMIHSPEIIILDEPTSDLDPLLRKEVLHLVKLINENGITVIIASHLLAELDEICSRIAILHKGKLLKIGSPDELKRKSGESSLDNVFEKTIKAPHNVKH